MTFSTDEKRVHDNSPRELYEFVLTGGDVAAYYYTNHHTDIAELGNTYLSVPITRTEISAIGSDKPAELIVTLPHDLGLVTELIVKIPPRAVQLQVRRYHTNIANVGLIWTGQVRSAQVNGRMCSLRVPSKMVETLESPVPSVAAQAMCNHVLYDTRCAVVRATFTTSTTVSTIDSANSRIVTVATVGGAGNQVFRGGEIVRTTDGERRLIVDQTGSVLTLSREFRTLAVSDAVDISQGCDHLVATCNTKFSNLVSFGGVPYIPAENLFRFGVKS